MTWITEIQTWMNNWIQTWMKDCTFQNLYENKKFTAQNMRSLWGEGYVD